MNTFDIEQLAMMLELEPPFGAAQVQLARRRMAKRWHPDIAPAGRQQAHENHLKAVNAAADQLEEYLAEARGGKITAAAVKTSAEAARKRRAEEGRRNYERQRAEEAQREQEQKRYDPFHSRVPDHSVVYRYARCNAYPEWGVGSILGIYFTGEGDDVLQWARVSFEVGVRTVPAGTLEFVRFGEPDAGRERARRFLMSAQNAMSEGDFPLAAQRLIYSRDADPDDPTVYRLMAVAFWQGGSLGAAARAVRDWVRIEPGRPAPHRYAGRIYEQMGLLELAAESAERECAADPGNGRAWARLGRLRLRLMQPEAAVAALSRTRVMPGATADAMLDLAVAQRLLDNTAEAADAARRATQLDDGDQAAWALYAIALDRTGASAECVIACDRALAIGDQPEITTLRARKLAERPAELQPAAVPDADGAAVANATAVVAA